MKIEIDRMISHPEQLMGKNDISKKKKEIISELLSTIMDFGLLKALPYIIIIFIILFALLNYVYSIIFKCNNSVT
jgi:hypothetical protein